MQTNILFIGFMGVGKGQIARAFSKKHNLFNIDTDDLIESKTHSKIKKLFKNYGESYFRILEQECADWIEKSVNYSVISCGGGFFNVKNIRNLGKIILLDASFEWIYQGILNSEDGKNKLAKRPLFNDVNQAKEIYINRKDKYKKVSDIIINVEDGDINGDLNYILEKIPY